MPLKVRKSQSKQQIALDLIDGAKANSIPLLGLTADEAYGRDGAFLNILDERGETCVVEIPPNAQLWMVKPKAMKTRSGNVLGRPKKFPRLRSSGRGSEPGNVLGINPDKIKSVPLKNTQ